MKDGPMRRFRVVSCIQRLLGPIISDFGLDGWKVAYWVHVNWIKKVALRCGRE